MQVSCLVQLLLTLHINFLWIYKWTSSPGTYPNIKMSDARCTHQLMWKVRNTPLVFFKKYCAPGTRFFLLPWHASSSSARDVPLLLPPMNLPAMPRVASSFARASYYATSCFFFFREPSCCAASLPASSARWLFFFCEVRLCPSCECVFFFRSSTRFRSSSR